MDVTKKVLYSAAGFVGGIAFLVSCGGGSGGGPISSADAAVPVNQMVCRVIGGRLWDSTTNGIPNMSANLVCYDTSGTGRTISIADAYAEGWRIQIGLVGASDGSSLHYIFEK